MKLIIKLLIIIAFSFISFSAYSAPFWQNIDLPFTETSTFYERDKDNNIYMGTNGNGLYLSKDNAKSWSFLGLKNTPMDKIFFSKEGHIYISHCVGGIYRSINKGKTWQEFNQGLLNKRVLKLLANSKGQIFCATQTGIYYLSKEDIWVQNNNSLTSAFINDIYINSKDEIFSAIVGGLFYSLDNTKTWYPIITNNSIFYVIKESSNKSIYAYGNKGKEYIYVSKDLGVTWIKKNENKNYGYRMSPFYMRTKIVKAKEYKNLKPILNISDIRIFLNDITLISYITNYNFNYYGWTYFELDKESFLFNLNKKELSKYNNDSIISYLKLFYEHYQRNKKKLLFDSFGNIKKGLLIENHKEKNIFKLDNFSVNKKGDMFVLIDNNLFRTNDFGKTWKNIIKNDYPKIRSFILDKNNNIIATNYYEYNNNAHFYISHDQGNTFKEIKTFIGTERINNIVINSEGKILLACDNGIFELKDDNSLFKIGKTELDKVKINTIKVGNNDNLYIGTTDGFFKFSKTKEIWEQINDGLNNTIVFTIDIDSKGYIYIGVNEGLFKSSLTEDKL